MCSDVCRGCVRRRLPKWLCHFGSRSGPRVHARRNFSVLLVLVWQGSVTCRLRARRRRPDCVLESEYFHDTNRWGARGQQRLPCCTPEKMTDAAALHLVLLKGLRHREHVKKHDVDQPRGGATPCTGVS